MQVKAKGSITKEFYQNPFARPDKEKGKDKKGKRSPSDNLEDNTNKDSYDQAIEDIQMRRYKAQIDQNYIAKIQEIQRQIQELERQKDELSQQYYEQDSMGKKAQYSKIMAEGLVKSYRLEIQTSKAVEAYEKHKTIAC